MSEPRVDAAIARFDELVARYEGRPASAQAARRRHVARSAASVGKRLANIAVALAVLILGTIGFGLLVGPIGWGGLFALVLASLLAVAFFAFWPPEPKRLAYSDELPARTVVQQLDTLLVRERPALPAPAIHRVDAISAQLPLLEARLADVDPLDPLAQDARRLMGKHLPELIERYERIPAEHRQERDSEGMTVDERLVSGLDAAHQALADLGARLTKGDLTALETQGRFLESRYKSDSVFKSE